MQEEQKIILIGAGLAGSLMAILLAKRGYAVDVYERRPDMRDHLADTGRSINLALSARGLHALGLAGLERQALEAAIPMKGRMMHDKAGNLTFQQYGGGANDFINSVSRRDLNILLMNAAEARENVRFYFQHKCEGVDWETGAVTVRDEVAQESRVVRGATVLAADGAGSAVRRAMEGRPEFSWTVDELSHGYKELTIPPAPDGGFLIEPNALHIWPRHDFMLIALPNQDKTFTCTLFHPYEGEWGFDNLNSDDRVSEFFDREFADTKTLIANLTTDFAANPTGKLATVRCYPWSVEDKAVIFGDAAHAVVPFYGQGMNASFEDCAELDACIAAFAPDWGKVFGAFQERRKPNADAIADLALDNFLVMRDQTADPVFLRKKELEILLEKQYPGEFLSRYSMVSFRRIPYREALLKGNVQDETLMKLCADYPSAEEIPLDAALDRVKKETAAAGFSV